MPVFALANAGVVISGELLSTILDPVALGIIFGLVVGKPLGVFILAYLSVKLGIAKLPSGLSWTQIVGIGFLAGIGFTMSTFISALAFDADTSTLETTKVAILIASFLAGLIGYVMLRNQGQNISTVSTPKPVTT
jgi:NhaA family Na+:H+ antiporter